MISKAWYVQCDICLDPAPVSTISAKDARVEAKYLADYIYKDKKDICPRCREIK